jgi:hypothetical protein
VCLETVVDEEMSGQEQVDPIDAVRSRVQHTRGNQILFKKQR